MRAGGAQVGVRGVHEVIVSETETGWGAAVSFDFGVCGRPCYNRQALQLER